MATDQGQFSKPFCPKIIALRECTAPDAANYAEKDEYQVMDSAI
jgi:hypothetical protein